MPVEAGPDDPVFVGRYRAVVDEIRTRQAGGLRATVVPRSLQYLIDVYRSSPEFQQLAESTRADYEKGLRPLEHAFGKMPVGGLAPNHLTRIREQIRPQRTTRAEGRWGCIAADGPGKCGRPRGSRDAPGR